MLGYCAVAICFHTTKPIIIVAEILEKEGIVPWLDEEQFQIT